MDNLIWLDRHTLNTIIPPDDLPSGPPSNAENAFKNFNKSSSRAGGCAESVLLGLAEVEGRGLLGETEDEDIVFEGVTIGCTT